MGNEDRLKRIVLEAVASLREAVSIAKNYGTEREVLEEFCQEVGSEIQGWEKRLNELSHGGEARNDVEGWNPQLSSLCHVEAKSGEPHPLKACVDRFLLELRAEVVKAASYCDEDDMYKVITERLGFTLPGLRSLVREAAMGVPEYGDPNPAKLRLVDGLCVTEEEWSGLVRQVYKRPYRFQQQDGCMSRGVYYLTVPDPHPEDFGKDTVPEVINNNEMGVSFSAWLSRDPKLIGNLRDSFGRDLWWDRNFYPSIEMVANDMHSKGILEAGRYVIIIDW